MATTKYEIRNGDEVLEVKVKKAQAIERGQQLAKELKTVITVVTTSGTEVATLKARKAQKKTKPYTRLVDLPEGFKIPEGMRPAYTRTRKDAVILHEPEGPEGKQYHVFNYVTGKALKRGLPTTRACGRFLADEVPAKEKANA